MEEDEEEDEEDEDRLRLVEEVEVARALCDPSRARLPVGWGSSGAADCSAKELAWRPLLRCD